MTKVYCIGCDNGQSYEDLSVYHLGEFADLDTAKKVLLDNVDTIRKHWMLDDFDSDNGATYAEGDIWITEVEKEDNGLILHRGKAICHYDYKTKQLVPSNRF